MYLIILTEILEPEILEPEIQPEETQEETPSVDRQTSKIVQIFTTHLDRILDPFL